MKHKTNLKPTKSKLTACNEIQIPVIGECENKINYRGKNLNLNFIVSNSKAAPTLGLNSSVQLSLIRCVMYIESKSFHFFENYNFFFFGNISCLPKLRHIPVKPDVTFVVTSARRVPIALRDKLKGQSDRMITLYVIELITEPTEWVSLLEKIKIPNGKKLFQKTVQF